MNEEKKTNIKKGLLTGIKPTGLPHIGNYFGSIKPSLELTNTDEYNTYLFVADYHALNSIKNKSELKNNCYEIAATWLACGLDPGKVVLYKQSMIPEIFELTIILQAFTPKGLMNRAHAYKAKIQENKENNKDIDDGVNVGLFTYPVLMAADILLFEPDFVPVGKDQLQHLEMTCDIAQAINFNYKKELFKMPKPVYSENTKTIIGLDGRKMSKSYNNTIPIFMPENQLKKVIMKIVTNSQTVAEPKNPDESGIYNLYKLFANEEEQLNLRCKYLNGGMGWGEAKAILFEKMNFVLSPIRERYYDLIKNKKYIDNILTEGAEKARYQAVKKMRKIRRVIGIAN